ncbi:beta-ketoacyl synthase N-terminal-like domain-containing protein [Luteolibacter marinus]|uniref:beta-ketoacyl synthase N-terminal-like domain-containing protein n=1 Tax=Luteolibacter marinus TaxID=2776705 RepID=UPI0018682A94
MITGTGVFCPNGSDVDEFWSNCLAGCGRVGRIPEHWLDHADLRSTLWAPLPELDLDGLGANRNERSQRDPVSLIGECAARQALAQAGHDLVLRDRRANAFGIPGVEAERAGIFVGTGIGGAHSFLGNFSHHLLGRAKREIEDLAGRLPPTMKEADELRMTGRRLVHPERFNAFAVSMLMPNATAAHLGQKFTFHGANVTTTVACAAGTVAIGQAFRAIQCGELDLALAGGCEYLRDDYGAIFRGFDIARTLVQDCSDPATANRPFDVQRSGFLLAEGGAGILCLEERGMALRRGATILAEVTGFAQTFDAHNMMSIAPDGRQVERMVRAAVADAGITPERVDYLNAHGTGTRINDAIESEVIARVFGPRVKVNSTKALTGHSIGASGALEAVVCAHSLAEQRTHACVNLQEPVADLAFVRSSGALEMDHALSQSFAFGGHNAALVFRRHQA